MRPHDDDMLARAKVGTAAAWYADPYARHQQRYWDGAAWTEHVADGGVTTTDPIGPSSRSPERPSAEPTSAADPGAARAVLERVVGESDGGHLPEHWPEWYEPAIAAVLGALEPGEQIRGGWRIRGTIRNKRASKPDVGVLVVTDRQVVGADHSSNAEGMFVLAVAKVAGVALDRSAMSPKAVDEIHLLDEEERILGDADNPATFMVFEEGKDPSGWSLHLRTAARLQSVRDQLLALLPAAHVGSSTNMTPLARHADASVRLRAAHDLQKAGDPRAVDVLTGVLLGPREPNTVVAEMRDKDRLRALSELQALDDGIPERSAVAALLVNAGSPKVSAPLVHALTASGGSLAVRALASIVPAAKRGDSGVSLGWRLEPGLAAAVASGLGDRDTASIEPLMLDDLGTLAESVLEGLVGDLANEDVTVAGNAALALGRLGDRRAVPWLGEFVVAAKDKNEWAAINAVDALVAIGGEEAEAWIENALLKGRLASVQGRAASALRRFDPDLVTAHLLAAARSAATGSRAQAELACALSYLDRPDATACLEWLVGTGARPAVAGNLASLADPMLRWAFAQHLHTGERPAFVVQDVPGPSGHQGGPTSLVALDDRFLVNRTGETVPIVVDGVARQVPRIDVVSYGRVTEVTLRQKSTNTSAAEGVIAGAVGGVLLGGALLTGLRTYREHAHKPWLVIRCDEVTIDLGGEEFLYHADEFISWLEQHIATN